MKVGGSGTAPQPQNCLGCRHYFITYDNHFPYGCKLLGIKSRRQPQVEVVAATGEPCQGYETRKTKSF